jgi:hypothetical protein
MPEDKKEGNPEGSSRSLKAEARRQHSASIHSPPTHSSKTHNTIDITMKT